MRVVLEKPRNGRKHLPSIPPRIEKLPQHTFAVVKQQPTGTNTSEDWAGDNLLHLQYNITPKHILHGSFRDVGPSSTILRCLLAIGTEIIVGHRHPAVSIDCKVQGLVHEEVVPWTFADDPEVVHERLICLAI